MTGTSALLLAADSWGGVASMITLAEALHGRGVNARIAAYSDFGDRVRDAGCEFIDLGVVAAGYWAEQNAQRPDWARNPVRTWAALRSGMKAQAPTIAASLADSARPGEVIVSGTLTVALASAVAGLRRSRVVALNPAPVTPSRLPQASLTPVLRRPSRLNEWAGRFGARGAEWLLRPAVTAGRATLGLPPWRARDYLAAVNQTPTIYGVSPALMPADPAWPAQVTVAGHLLRPDPDPAIPEGLPQFLAGHPGAVYVGFGSWGNAVTQSGLDIACRALALAGRPGVIAGSAERGVVADASTPVFAVGEVSHDWLFPRLAAVVHHGGSGHDPPGSPRGSAEHGRPHRLRPALLGPPPGRTRCRGAPDLVPQALAPRLASAIGRLTDNPDIAARAKQLGAVLSAENGPSVAARVIMGALGT